MRNTFHSETRHTPEMISRPAGPAEIAAKRGASGLWTRYPDPPARLTRFPDMKHLLPVAIAIVVCLFAHSQDRPSPPAEAAGKMTVPAGFKATLFAGEPDVVQPIAFTLRRPRPALGRRVPVVSELDRSTAEPGKDRILIFEDTDGDGTLRQAHRLLRQAAPTSPASSSASAASGSARTPNLLFIPSTSTPTDQARRASRRSCSTAGTSRTPSTTSSTA